MTHDELLAKVEKINLVSCDQTIDILEKIVVCGECFVCQALYALHSVVELHKPFEIDREGNYNCQECEWGYPCQTIRSIEKELG